MIKSRNKHHGYGVHVDKTTAFPYKQGVGAAATYEWDEAKAAANVAKHGVSFHTAVEAFNDAKCMVEADTRANYGEERFRLFATVEGFPICVVYTVRGDAIRIISARKANRKER